MSGLNFPDSPTPGQMFSAAGSEWVWDGIKWESFNFSPPPGPTGPTGPPGNPGSTGSTGATGATGPMGGFNNRMTVGSSPPTSPAPAEGDLWWDDAGGQLYVYYVDANSAQWVVANSGTEGPPGPPGPAAVSANPGNIATLGTDNLLLVQAPITVAQGGTNATTAPAALVNLGAAPIASPTFTGTVTLPTAVGVTPATSDNSTHLATTAYVQNQGYITPSYVSAYYLPLGGGTITGGLTVNAQLTSSSVGQIVLNGGNPSTYASNGYGRILQYATNGNWMQQYQDGGGGHIESNTALYINQLTGSTVVFPTITVNGNLNIYGGTFENGASNGWLYFTGSLHVNDFQSANNVNAAGSLIFGGNTIQNSGGYTYTPQSFYSAGEVSAGDAVHVGGNNSGVYWINSGGSMTCSTNVSTSGVYYTNGMYWQNNSGFMYCPWPVQANGQINSNSGGFYAYNSWGIYFDSSCPWGSSNHWTLFWNGTIYISIDGGGAVWMLANASDARIKAEIAAKDSNFDCLDIIKKIPLFQYKPKRVTNTRDIKRARLQHGEPHYPVGFVAQELYKVYPWGVLPGDSDENTLGKLWQIEQNVMLATLVGAMQQLEARLAALEG
jgi:hypothetical protein